MVYKYILWLYVLKILLYMIKWKVLVMEWLNGDCLFDLLCIFKGLFSVDGIFFS